MLRPSFVPPAAVRDLRQLTRVRAVLAAESSRHRNWIEKVLEDALLKITSVLPDVLGLSGRQILNALVAGQRPAKRWRNWPTHRCERAEPNCSPHSQANYATTRHRDQSAARTDRHPARQGQLDIQITALIGELPGARGVCTNCGVTGTAHAPTCPDLALPILSLAERLDEITGVGLLCAHVIIAELDTGAPPDSPP
ncbi:hypothetical protein [Actinomadura macra]|uniref:hypothetical protein n=1 Tax=Actinomadura macra TaxID=46164 RepID=UPI00082B9B1A|nr:hypothetical protein [Actinomadura macra]